MILILEDDADREAYGRGDVAFDPDRLPPEEFRQPVTVWISPEAYRKDAVLTDLRVEVQAMRDEAQVAFDHGKGAVELEAAAIGIVVLDDVLAVIDGYSDE